MLGLNHLLLTTVEDPFDRKSWSGIPYSLRKALERRIGKITVFRPSPPVRAPIDVIKRAVYGGSPPRYPLWMTKSTLSSNARELASEIEKSKPDAVLSISSQCVAYLQTPQCPVFLFSDAPWLAYHNAYAEWDPMPVSGRRFAADEAIAARRLDGLCYGSEWACNQAVELFGAVVANKVHEAPLGANWTPSPSAEEIIAAVDSRPTDELRLLFVGKDWTRKGGPLAVEVAEQIHNSGQKVHLHVVGCNPDLPDRTKSFITVHGRLYQTDPHQSLLLEGLFLSSHFLFVPTTAECFGIVFAEAQAFALPPVSRAVNSLPSVVRDNETGLLFSPYAPAGDYVDRITKLFHDRDAYTTMCIKARQKYQTSLNWDNTANIIALAIEQKLAA